MCKVKKGKFISPFERKLISCLRKWDEGMEEDSKSKRLGKNDRSKRKD